MKPSHEAGQAALAALAILQGVMLAALFARTAPHPPLATPLFAMGPFLAAALALIAAALLLGALSTRMGRVFAALAAAAALVSFGPQKWLDPHISQIWPAVLGGEIAALTLIVGALLGGRARAV